MKNTRYALMMLAALTVTAAAPSPGIADPEANEHITPTVIRALPTAKHSLAEAVELAGRSEGAPLSAKYEMDGGKLSLSIYTAKKAGKKTVFEETAGDPSKDAWTPTMIVMQDKGDLKRAKKQWALLSKTKVTLLDVLKTAGKAGTVVSITPDSGTNGSKFETLLAVGDRVTGMEYDLRTGAALKEGNPE